MASEYIRDKGSPGFDHVTTWIFDLDNTLYPSTCNLFDQIDVRMKEFISNFLDVDLDEARRIQKLYFHQHGTTLSGLMREHGMAPQAFLDYVHDIDVSPVPPNPSLVSHFQDLPGQKYIFTNGSRRHAENVAGQIGVLDHVDGIFDIVAADYVPKPAQATCDRFLEHLGLQGPDCAMFEDISGNLVAPHAHGMVTVLVETHKSWGTEPGGETSIFQADNHDHIHYTTPDLTDFLKTSVLPNLSVSTLKS